MRRSIPTLAAAIVLSITATAAAQNEFTYQGQLKAADVPASGEHDFIFRLFEADNGGNQIGSAVNINDWPVEGGLFTVLLDFGANVFSGQPRWLQVEVRPGSSSNPHTVLAPRQLLTSVPFAMYAFDGPGSGGYWSLNGSKIYNNNTGYVGIGTNDPQTNLEVRARTTPRLRVAKIHTGGFGTYSPAVLELQSNFVGTEQPYGSLRFLDGDAAVRGSVEYGPEAGLLSPTSMRFATEGQTRMWITADGNVGVGTNSPGYEFEVAGGIYAETSNWAIRGVKTGSGTFPGVWGETESASSNASGVRGYVNHATPGTDSAGVLGQNLGTNANGSGVIGKHAGGGHGVYGRSETGTGVRGISNSASGYGGVFGDLSTPGKGVLVVGNSAFLSPISIGTTSIPSGTVLNVAGAARVDVLEIVGADIAEKFPTSESDTLEPGTVMAIDPKNPGELCVARGAYNRCVAGVVSGAGDLPVGAVLGHLPEQCPNAPAIALSGRAWVRCDASDRAIAPGDLLTTADTPGHAMAVTNHDRAHGAVIGKAMSALAQGERGLVLVLVNLH